MNWIDMFIIVLLAWAVFRGYSRGFIMQLTMLAALIIGVYAALKLSGYTAEHLHGKLKMSAEALNLVAMGITFALAFIGVNLAGRLVEKLAESIDLSFTNRLLGVALGVAKTVVLLGILLAFANKVDRNVHFLPKNSREHSLFYKPFTSIATAIFPSLAVRESGRATGIEQV